MMNPAANPPRPPSDFDRAWGKALSSIDIASDRIRRGKVAPVEPAETACPRPPVACAPSAPAPVVVSKPPSDQMKRIPKKTRMEFKALHEEQLASSDAIRREQLEEEEPAEKLNGHESTPRPSSTWIGRLFTR